MGNKRILTCRGRIVATCFLWALLSMMVLFTSCQSINPLPKFGVGDASPEETKIRELMNWHSGRTEVYRGFRTVFTARAVYLSEEIQKMAADWEARSRLLSPEERSEFEKKYIDSDIPLVKILLGFYTPQENLNQLSRDNSNWIVYLKNTDETITRATCLDLDEDSTRIYMRFLKWDISWSKLYIICFPYAPERHSFEDGFISMVISGPQGQGEIRLQVLPPGDS